LRQDDAAISNASEQITHAQNELSRVEAQHKVMQLQFDRLNGVAKSKPGLVAQQEVDDAEGKALASAAQVEASRANLQSAQSAVAAAKAKREHDQDLRRRNHAALRQLWSLGPGRDQLQHASDADRPPLRGRFVPPCDSGAGDLCQIHSHR
jgi:phage-related baseplate assembly protein